MSDDLGFCGVCFEVLSRDEPHWPVCPNDKAQGDLFALLRAAKPPPARPVETVCDAEGRL